MKIISIIFALVFCSAFKVCDDLAKDLANVKKDTASSFNSASEKIPVNPIYFVSKQTAAKNPVNLDYDQCVEFSTLKSLGSDIYYVDNKLLKPGNGESWDKAFSTINQAIAALIAKRTQDLAKGQPIAPAIVAIASGHYTYTAEKVITNEIFSLYGYKKELYKNLSFLGGFKNNDICKNVSKNKGYNYADPDRQTIIDGENKTKIIAAIDASTLVFSDFVFRNSKSNNIANKQDGGSVSIKDSAFIYFNRVKIDNSYAHGLGGAFFIKDTQGVNFIDIHSINTFAKNHGGAIAIIKSNILINNINIEQAQSEQNGGAIYNDNNSDLALGYFILAHNEARNGAGLYNKGKLVIHTNSFINGSSKSFYDLPTNDFIDIDHARGASLNINNISHNKALETAGAMYYDHLDQLILDTIIIEDNHAHDAAGIYFAQKALLSIKNSRFLHNHALNNAGALFFNNGVELTNEVSMKEVVYIGHVVDNKILNNFSYNTANNEGGVFYIQGETEIVRSGSSNLTLFKGNKAKKGAVFALAALAKLPNSNNSARNMLNLSGDYQKNESEEAGLFYINSANIKKISINGNFKDNKITNADAAILKSVHSLDNIDIAGKFANNTCSKNTIDDACDGAAFNIDQVKQLRLVAENIEDHKAQNGGFLWINNAENLIVFPFLNNHLSNIFIKNNQATNNGGVIYANKINSISIKAFTESHLSYLFLAIQHRILKFKGVADGSYIQPRSLIFAFNKAINGGVLYVENSDNVSIKEAIFNANVAKSGAALYLADINGDLEVKESFFSNNTASISGGALYVGKANNAIFDGKRNMNPGIGINFNKKEYMISNFKDLPENDKNTYIDNLAPIEYYLDNLAHFENTHYNSNQIYLPLAKNNISSNGAFAYFDSINNLNLQYMSMVNNKNNAVFINMLSGSITKDQNSIIYDNGEKIKNIEVFLGDFDYSTRYYKGDFPKGLPGYTSYEDDVGISSKSDTGIKVNNQADKSIPSD